MGKRARRKGVEPAAAESASSDGDGAAEDTPADGSAQRRPGTL